jgi:hypothetical protein
MAKDTEQEYGETSWGESKDSVEDDTAETTLYTPAPTSLQLQDVPVDWAGWTKANKVQYLVDVLQFYITKVRSGNFDLSKTEALAALALEAQIELADFYADAESYSRDAKNIAEDTESEVSEEILRTSINNSEKKPSDATIKRQATINQKVKEAKKKTVQLERNYKKWRYIYDMLKDAHIFFRNLGKV